MRPISKRRLVLAVGDGVLAVVFFQLSYFLRIGENVNVLRIYTGASTFCILTLLGSLYVFDLYDYRQHRFFRDFLPNLLIAFATASSLPALVLS